ncbi:hypothetical protein AB0M48_20525 [Lentzea sp. NPDC051208]
MSRGWSRTANAEGGCGSSCQVTIYVQRFGDTDEGTGTARASR